MKPNEMLAGSATKMKLNGSTSNIRKWHYGSLKLIFLVLFFASMCNLSSGGKTGPAFTVQYIRKDCRKYITPKTPKKTPDNDLLHLWPDNWSGVDFEFEQIEGKWGYIVHRRTGKVWYPKNNGQKKKTRIVLNSEKEDDALFAMDEVNGNVQHRSSGLYVSVVKGWCLKRQDIYLWDSPDNNWKFAKPRSPTEDVHPYGTFKVLGEWKCLRAEHTMPYDTEITLQIKTGYSTSKSTTHGFQFSWQVSAEARIMFLKAASASTDVSLTYYLETSKQETWTHERTVTHIFTVPKGDSYALWQKSIVGEQVGFRGEFQAPFIAYTKSRNKPPPDDDLVESVAGRRSSSRVYYYYLNDTDMININMDELKVLKLYQNEQNISALPDNEISLIANKESVIMSERISITEDVDTNITISDEQLELENIKEDTSVQLENTTKGIQFDKEGVFALVGNHNTVDNAQAEYNEDTDYDEDENYDEDETYDADESNDEDENDVEFEIEEVNQNKDKESSSLANTTNHTIQEDVPLNNKPTERMGIGNDEDRTIYDYKHQENGTTTPGHITRN